MDIQKVVVFLKYYMENWKSCVTQLIALKNFCHQTVIAKVVWLISMTGWDIMQLEILLARLQ